MSQGVTSEGYERMLRIRQEEDYHKMQEKEYCKKIKMKYLRRIKSVGVCEKNLKREGYMIRDYDFKIFYREKGKKKLFIGKLNRKKINLEYKVNDLDQIGFALNFREILDKYKIPYKEIPTSSELSLFFKERHKQILGLLKRLS